MKCLISDAGDTIFNHNFFNIRVPVYRTLIIRIAIIFHCTRTADIQCSILIQFPGQVIFDPISIAFFHNLIAIRTVQVAGITGFCSIRF